MEQIRHGSTTTTHAMRAAIQRSQASFLALSEEFGISPKTVAQSGKCQAVEDQKSGLKEPCSTVLSETAEAMIVVFRRHAYRKTGRLLWKSSRVYVPRAYCAEKARR